MRFVTPVTNSCTDMLLRFPPLEHRNSLINLFSSALNTETHTDLLNCQRSNEVVLMCAAQRKQYLLQSVNMAASRSMALSNTVLCGGGVLLLGAAAACGMDRVTAPASGGCNIDRKEFTV